MPELELAVSATTREQRPGEQNGREYWFITPEKFERLVEDDEFLEHVDLPWGARSGTLRSEIDRIQAHGKVPLLDLETDGALRVQETIPGAVTIFVDAPTFDELEQRLRERATESSAEIRDRLRAGASASDRVPLQELLDHGPRGSLRGQAQVQVPQIAAQFGHGPGTRRRHRWDRRLQGLRAGTAPGQGRP